jgi:lipopolysaccharide transport system permease protein
LIWTFTLCDVKVRYRQTLIGVLWAVLQPLLSLVIFVTMFGLLGKQPVQEGVPYHVVALCGLVVWQLFGTGVPSASAALVSYRHWITKVYFPRLALPISVLLSSLVDFVCAASLIVILGGQYVLPPSPAILVAPFFVLLAFFASLACGIWLSALNGLYRDFGHLAPFLLQMGFFLSPVVYQTEGLIPPRWQLLFAFNPLVGAIEGFRWSVIGQGDFPWFAILTSGSVSYCIVWRRESGSVWPGGLARDSKRSRSAGQATSGRCVMDRSRSARGTPSGFSAGSRRPPTWRSRKRSWWKSVLGTYSRARPCTAVFG